MCKMYSSQLTISRQSLVHFTSLLWIFLLFWVISWSVSGNLCWTLIYYKIIDVNYNMSFLNPLFMFFFLNSSKIIHVWKKVTFDWKKTPQINEYENEINLHQWFCCSCVSFCRFVFDKTMLHSIKLLFRWEALTVHYYGETLVMNTNQ